MEFFTNKNIPYYYLYDEKGSQLFHKITSLEEYYPFRKEKEILENQITNIISSVYLNSPKIHLIEFGAGYSVKTKIIIERLSQLYNEVVFVPIDVCQSACDVSVEKFSYLKNVKILPKCISNEEFLNRFYSFDSPVIYLFLGSSIGNLAYSEQLVFLNKLSKIMNFQDELICGFDHEVSEFKERSTILSAYNDKELVTAEFITNILSHIKKLFKLKLNCEDFEYLPVYNDEEARVEMYLNCIRDTSISDENNKEIILKIGEKIFIEYSHKFNKEKIIKLCSNSNLKLTNIYTDKDKYFMLCSIKKDINSLFELTDKIFEKYIGYENIHSNPIELRNKMIFYLGHIYVFYDIKLFNLQENEKYYQYFERGRDPIISNDECHRHSCINVEYPDYKEILSNNNLIKEKIHNHIVAKGYTYELLMCIEHEMMHQETLIYATRMMKRDIELINLPEKYSPPEKKIIEIPKRKITQGKLTQFGWDNEFPIHEIEVEAFNVDNLPITWADLKEFIDYQNENFTLFNFDRKSNRIRLNENNWIEFELGKFLPAWVNLEVAEKYVEYMIKKGVNCRIMSENEFDSLSSNKEFILNGNINFKFNHAVPIGYMNDYSEDLVGELYGNGWELTSTSFKPFIGFKQMEIYPEYSSDFFTNFHYVLKGASPYTNIMQCRKSFRNWYQKDYSYHCSKFRLAYM